jgi:hypothetical protein
MQTSQPQQPCQLKMYDNDDVTSDWYDDDDDDWAREEGASVSILETSIGSSS